jgi:hypothetical protein
MSLCKADFRTFAPGFVTLLVRKNANKRGRGSKSLAFVSVGCDHVRYLIGAFSIEDLHPLAQRCHLRPIKISATYPTIQIRSGNVEDFIRVGPQFPSDRYVYRERKSVTKAPHMLILTKLSHVLAAGH